MIKIKATAVALAACSAMALLGTSACSSDDDSNDGGGGGMSASGGSTSTGGGSSSGGMGGSGSCQSIVDIAAANPDFSTLVAAVTKAGLVEALGGENLTVFAPTNDAFADLLSALGVNSLDDLSADQLTPILTYHVMDSVVDSAAAISVATEGDMMATTLGGTIDLDVVDAALVVDADEAAATVTTADIMACNGVIHVVDAVLLPSIADIVTTQAGFSGLAGLVGDADSGDAIAAVLDGPATDVDDTLNPGGLTLFAPNNAAVTAAATAFPSLTGAQLDDILQYHVYASDNAVDAATALGLSSAAITMVNGDELTVDGGSAVTVTDTGGNDATVTIADIYAANGIIHVIDGVVLPDSITAP